MVRSVRVLPNATLAEALRGPLDLTGTKIGCDRGASSACTVWLDGACVASCMVLAIDVGNRVGCHALAWTQIEGRYLDNAYKLPIVATLVCHAVLQATGQGE